MITLYHHDPKNQICQLRRHRQTLSGSEILWVICPLWDIWDTRLLYELGSFALLQKRKYIFFLLMPLRWPSLFHTFIILSTSRQDNGDCDNHSVQRWRAGVGGCRSQSICSALALVPALNNSAPLFPHFPHILHQSALHSTTTLDTIHHKFLPNWAPVLPQGRPPPTPCKNRLLSRTKSTK